MNNFKPTFTKDICMYEASKISYLFTLKKTYDKIDLEKILTKRVTNTFVTKPLITQVPPNY